MGRSPIALGLERDIRKLSFIRLEMKGGANGLGIAEGRASLFMGRLIKEKEYFVGGGRIKSSDNKKMELKKLNGPFEFLLELN